MRAGFQRTIKMLHLLLLTTIFGSFPSSSFAHSSSTAYLSANYSDSSEGLIKLQWEVSLLDLQTAIGLDTDGDNKITWKEVKTASQRLEQLATSTLELSEPGLNLRCNGSLNEVLADKRAGLGYAILRLNFQCPNSPSTVNLKYSFLFEKDPSHRLILHKVIGSDNEIELLSPEKHLTVLTKNSADTAHERKFPLVFTILSFLDHGIWHILMGYDHILFLITLLVPIMNLKGNNQRSEALTFRKSLVEVVKTATGFTIGHSITLALAATTVITPPSSIIEPAIALSITYAAIENLITQPIKGRWKVASFFGLIHGCGFGSALLESGNQGASLVAALLGFNLGVEAGQALIIFSSLPILFLISRLAYLAKTATITASICSALLGVIWFIERIN